MSSLSSQTRIYISVSSRPGRFGAAIYNELFDRYGVDAVYLPRSAPDSAADLASSLRTLGISGCSVSMPLKAAVIGHLDEADSLVAETRSCNTIVNTERRLKGFNTDVFGFQEALASRSWKPKSILIYGGGAVTASVVAALRRMPGTEIFLAGRNPGRSHARAADLGVKHYDGRENRRFDLLVNATPVSLNADSAATAFAELIPRVDTIFDLPVSPSPTPLVQMAQGKESISGIEMAVFQLQQQFHLYCAHWVESEEIKEIARRKYFS